VRGGAGTPDPVVVRSGDAGSDGGATRGC
jgi:hypothetical protein